ncbi:hypothetical protein ACTD5D_22035 [Nocardia takedensis]|uniref:hypothetical protein n=1 Tax=Nocardia takedensis TaxID=259390 RepID=UPI003F761D5A
MNHATAGLWFPRAEVLDLAEHAMAAPDHDLDPYDETGTKAPALIWIHDMGGIYLVSNGLPRQTPTADDDPTNKMHVVYAHGHRPGRPRHYHPLLAGHHFDHMRLTTTLDGAEPTLLDLLRDTDTDPGAWFVLIVRSEGAHAQICDTGPS